MFIYLNLFKISPLWKQLAEGQKHQERRSGCAPTIYLQGALPAHKFEVPSVMIKPQRER